MSDEHRLRRLEDLSARVRIGTVTDTSPLTVTLGAGDVEYADIRCIDGIDLSVDDTVAALTWGHDLLVLGRIGTPT